jgi:putative endonuclease
VDKTFYVYMLASTRYGTLYLGVTFNLMKPVWEHREGMVERFTKEYGVKQLVWFETHIDAISPITREKQLMKWDRVWKIKLIQQENPYWRDLCEEFAA